MGKSSVFQVQEIGENIARLTGRPTGQKVMQRSEGITSSSKPEKVAHWVQGAMETLDALVDEGTRDQIMMSCGYNCARVNHSPIDRAQARRRNYDTESESLAAEQRHPPPGTRLLRQGSILHQYYTPHAFTRPMRCYCSLLRGRPAHETASLTYCQCSRGFVQKYWEGVLGRPISVELLESCASGAQECRFSGHL